MNIKDYLHYYLGCKIENQYFGDRFIIGGLKGISNGFAVIQNYDVFGDPWTDLTWKGFDKIKPILRPLASLTREDFAALFEENAMFRWCKHHWYGANIDEGDESEEDFDSLMSKYEESNPESILAFNLLDYTFSYGGLDEEWFYSIPVKEYARIINILRSRGLDCDGLIKAGLAIDSTTINNNKD